MRIGVDLGGTKIEAIALSPGGNIPARRRVETPQTGYRDVLSAIATLVDAIEADAGGGRVPRIGVGIPGSLSPADGRVRNANSTVLNGHPLNTDLAEITGREVRLENDANCFALAEALSGAGQGLQTIFGVILGTGVGGGIVTGGQVLRGANLIGGEWGHNPLPSRVPEPDPAPACYCGWSGCIEAWCSGPGMAADHRRDTGEGIDPSQIANRAAAGDAICRATLDRHLDRLARALASVVNVLDPDAIILGGGLSNLGHLYDRLPDAMRPHVFSDVFATPVLKNSLGDSAGVIGAAWLWPAEGT